MAYQRVTLATLRPQLADRLKTVSTFWPQNEQDQALNEAIAIWQAMTGESTITVTQSITQTTVNLVSVATTFTQGDPLSVIRVLPASGASLRELSLPELDQGFYGWRTETAAATTQRPEYWAPVGVGKVMVYPRTGATATYTLHCYADAVPLTDSASYIDVSEGELTRLLGLAQSILMFKEGVIEGTENAKALRDLFMFIAETRNRELTKTALYRNYMGHNEGLAEGRGEVAEQTGVRG